MKITLVYFDAGGGHRAARNALVTVLGRTHPGWEVTSLNLQELLDELDVVRKCTGFRTQDAYNHMLKSGFTLGAATLLRALHGLIRLLHRGTVRKLEQHWRESQPDMVVSLIPNFNRALAESVRRVIPAAPFVTILTDFADYPPHFWMERESEYLICGTEHATEQASAMGHPREQVFQTSGMILNPGFYADSEGDRASERQAIGLSPDRPTGLVMFGGQGARAMRVIAERLDGNDNLQLIFICGRNRELRNELERKRFSIPVFVEGFTDRVQHYMQLADFFIGKPGPGSLSEALQKGLPVIVTRNALTLPQERFNTDWIRDKKLGIVISSYRHIAPAVGQLIAPGALEVYRANARALPNRAVFEIPEILERILAKGGSGARALPATLREPPLEAV